MDENKNLVQHPEYWETKIKCLNKIPIEHHEQQIYDNTVVEFAIKKKAGQVHFEALSIRFDKTQRVRIPPNETKTPTQLHEFQKTVENMLKGDFIEDFENYDGGIGTGTGSGVGLNEIGTEMNQNEKSTEERRERRERRERGEE